MDFRKKGVVEVEKCGYLGPEGTFSEMAALKYCQEEEEIIPLTTIREVVDKVKSGDINNGVIPMENSLEGSVNMSMDLLFKESDIKITGEVIIPIEHYLMAPPGMKLVNIKQIYSHPQAIAQTRDFVYRNLPDVGVNYTESTAAAAAIVTGSHDKAMIGSRRINQLYNLEILAEKVEDDIENYTRFVVISLNGEEKEMLLANNQYKTSLICTPEVNQAGVLYEILGEFATRQIDLTRIESRPTRKKLGEYLFYIDLAGHQENQELAAALMGVKEKCGLFKILGSYPREKI